jgi:iron complex outermembrane receptor protein
MVTPNEISRVDVIYGPFSALYPGNSYGGIVTFSTRMPDQFEAHLAAKGFDQRFDLYKSDGWFPGDNFSLAIGNRYDAFSFWLTYDHVTALSQPLQFTNVPAQAPFPFIKGLPVFGSVPYTFPDGTRGVLLGASAIYTDEQDLAKLKLAYDFAPAVRLTYTGALWNFRQYQAVDPYVHDSFGNPIANSPFFFVQTNGQFYPLFGLDPSNQTDQRLMQGLEFKSDTHGVFDFDAVVSHLLMLNNQTLQSLNYGLDQTGQDWIQSGSGWITSDLRGIWRPDLPFLAAHEISIGGHFDQYALRQRFNNPPDWESTNGGVIASESRGITQTKALYIQDAWSFLPNWKLIVGGREEWWDTFNGANINFGSGGRSRADQTASARSGEYCRAICPHRHY